MLNVLHSMYPSCLAEQLLVSLLWGQRHSHHTGRSLLEGIANTMRFLGLYEQNLLWRCVFPEAIESTEVLWHTRGQPYSHQSQIEEGHLLHPRTLVE